MNIWLINHYAVPPQYYPLARQTYFAKHLMAMGHKATIFAASTVHNSNRNLINNEAKWKQDIVDGVKYVYIKCKNYNGNGISRIINMCEFALKLPRVCKQFVKPDAIIATSMPPISCAMGIRLARKYCCRGIAEIADLWPESLVAYDIASENNPAVIVLRWLEKWIYKKADAIVFTMEGAYDYILEQKWEKVIPQSKVYYINNGVDLELFRYNREQFNVEDPDLDDPDTIKVIYTGSIRKVNNLGLLLDAAKYITNPKVRLLIWGDGDEREYLKQRAKEEALSNVIFKGFVEKKYVPSIVSRASLNIAHNSPSPLFRFGISFNKLFDYLAAGKPVLCDFPCKYNPAVNAGAAIDVSEPNAEKIASAIDMLAGMPQAQYEKLCENAMRAAEEYDFKHLTQKLLNVIENKA